jgi:uncharacterized protein (TIGR02588 family)
MMPTHAPRRDDATQRQPGSSREPREGRAPGHDREPPAPQEISKWEWAVGALGLLLLLALVGFLAREATTSATPPDLTARVDSVSRLTSGWLAHVRVLNRGRETAVEVTVEGELVAGSDTVRRETTLDYVPGRSERGGGLLFDRDPSSGRLDVRATGYQEP